MSLIWFFAISMAGIATTRLLLRDAVEGYEDDTGFHYAAVAKSASTQPVLFPG